MIRPTPSRRTQPYKRTGGRGPGQTLDAMLRGAPLFLPNPMDMQRQTLASRMVDNTGYSYASTGAHDAGSGGITPAQWRRYLAYRQFIAQFGGSGRTSPYSGSGRRVA